MKTSVLHLFSYISVLAMLFAAPGCAIIYEQDVQQGNVVTDEMLNKLQAGMNKTEVQYYIGTPLIEDPFHANRWDYYYTFHQGGEKTREQRVITLWFDEQELLADITGSVELEQANAPEVGLPDEGELNTVVSDTEQSEEGFWQSLKRKVLSR